MTRWPIALLVAIMAAGAPAGAPADAAENLPAPGFEIDQTRSNNYRGVREFRADYRGPLFDVQAHIRRPKDDRDDYLKNVMGVMARAGVSRMLVMATPNEGRRENHEKDADYRRRLAGMSGGRIQVMCGGNYSYWMHRAWRDGYSKSELAKILDRLGRAIIAGKCVGLGEIGLYHFNKNGRQAVISYPPNFEPFVKLIGVAAANDVWVILHAEPVTPDGESYEARVFGALALLYARYPRLKLILAHSGMTNMANARRILGLYSGLVLDFKTIHQKKHKHWRNLEPINDSSLRLFEDWAKLMEEMPDRFIAETDAKFGRERRYPISRYDTEIARMRAVLGSIDPKAARMIGFDNAARMFGDVSRGP